MTRDHERIEELLAADALGGLDPSDREELARLRAEHGACEECERLEAGFAETAGRLAFALEPAPVGDDVADGILRRAAEPRSRGVRRGIARPLVAVAAVLILLVAVLVIRDVTRPDRFTVAFAGSSSAELQMRFTPGDDGARLRGTGFEALPADQAYELWAIRDGTPIRATCFIPSHGQVQLSLSTPVEGSDVMAVTVESSSCPGAPTTDPILTADLSAVS